MCICGWVDGWTLIGQAEGQRGRGQGKRVGMESPVLQIHQACSSTGATIKGKNQDWGLGGGWGVMQKGNVETKSN